VVPALSAGEVCTTSVSTPIRPPAPSALCWSGLWWKGRRSLASSASPSPTKGGRVSSISSHSSSPVVSIDFPSRQPGQSYRPLPLPHRLLASSIVCSMVARPCYPLPTTAASATDLVGVALLPNQACRSPVPIGVQIENDVVHLRTSLVQLFALLLQNWAEVVQIIELRRFGGAPNGYPFAALAGKVGGAACGRPAARARGRGMD
jgi:hypothetical protein